MTMSILDKSNYFKGLLILIGKDRMIDERERNLMLKVGKMLDFEREFCETAIDDLLENKHITDEPVVFEREETAISFILDALRVAMIDSELHSHEYAWLQSVASANNIGLEWLDSQISDHQSQQKSSNDTPMLEVFRRL